VDWNHRFDDNAPFTARFPAEGLETTPWKTLEIGLIDPLANTIRFCEPIKRSTAQ